MKLYMYTCKLKPAVPN